ncbi:MAG: glycerol-3-phosphate dehydrogenase [Bacillota bacterium]|nr:glycerol-3-phosphate dehydrogenase [Bacillota bacterium]
MSIITIIGAGMMGSAMSYPATENSHEVRLVGTPLDRDIIEHAVKTGEHLTLKRKLPSGIKFFQFEEFSKALTGADVLISGVNSFGVDWFMTEILPLVPQTLPILSITKGMITDPDDTLVSYPKLYSKSYYGKNLSINAVGGPCTSYELADHDQTEVCFCGKDIEILRKFKALFETPYYHISLSTDVEGVEYAVALKNAYALGVTLAVGLSERKEGIGGTQHYNSQAALFGQSIREIRKLLKLAKVQDDNIIFAAGDLYVTIFGGRTRKIGTLLGRGLSFKEAISELNGVTLESIVISTRTAAALRSMINKGIADPADFPLLLHIDDIINHGAPIDIDWNAFTTEYKGN